MSHQEMQIAPGVYITDFRKNGNLVGIKEPQQPLTNDVGLLLDECTTLESKSKMLQFTIEEIKRQQNWQQDGDFREAVQENWAIIVKFSGQLKQKILRLAELNYQPETAKIQELINVDRIQTREARARAELSKIVHQRQLKLQKEKEEQSSQGIYL